jgi:long-chain acyl-CoA synthetase
LRDHLAPFLDDFRRYGGEIAVVRHQGNRRRVTTYGEIARLAGRFAALLAGRGIGPGDRVLIWAENSAEWIAAFHGCMLRGVLAVPLDANGSADFAARVAADVTPKLAVGDTLLLSRLAGEVQRLSFEEWLAALPAEEAGPVPGLSAETPLQILFTSGTTGDPKGIVLTHGNVMASIGPIARASQPYMRYERLIHPLRILNTLPLSHVFGQTMGLWVPPIYRAELHFEERLAAPRLIETIRRERISVLAAVPRVLALLKTHLEATLPELAERVAGPKGTATGVSVPLRWWRFRDVHSAFGLKFWAIISGGGALPGPLEKFWNAVGLVVVQGYGMTETTALITLNHPFHVAQGTIGKPLAGREVKLGPDGEVLVRGASISSATWSGGALHPRSSEWLATGDLAQTEPSGELRFLGRKSEVIVTAAGLNLHPEDLEAAIEREPGVQACAVVGLDTPAGPEPCAVLAFRGARIKAAEVIEQANGRLAEFQRILRWEIWPEPDLPRTSTGKVRRKAVAEWLEKKHRTAIHAGTAANGVARNGGTEWLLALIEQVTGEEPTGAGDEMRLIEDLHLDSLGRVQLAAAIEERLGLAAESGLLEEVRTLGELRRLVAGNDTREAPSAFEKASGEGVGGLGAPGLASETWETTKPSAPSFPQLYAENEGENLGAPSFPRLFAERVGKHETQPRPAHAEPQAEPAPPSYLYPHWPWWLPFRWLRAAFTELVMRPLVWLLAKPEVAWDASGSLKAGEPMLIVANHVTSFDGPLLEYALPGRIRRRIAVAMSGEMLEEYRHFRNPERETPNGRFYPPGPLIYLLLTALFNVFPLPKRRDFQRSFAHAGEALDQGFNVLLFPEGTRSAAGELARFRAGIGLLAKQSSAAVLPMAIRGLGALKTRQRGWFRSGSVEVRVGRPMRFSPLESEAQITARLHSEVDRLLNG